MTELPKLIIGCGTDFPPRFECGIKGFLCSICQHNKDAVLAHAAAHQKEMYELIQKLKSNVSSEINRERINDFCKAKRARDAVLKLAGLSMIDLKETKNV